MCTYLAGITPLSGNLNGNMSGLKIYTSSTLTKLSGIDLMTSTTNDIYKAMQNDSVAFFFYDTNSKIMEEMGNANGGAIMIFRYTEWRGFGYATCVQSGTDAARIGHIYASNTLRWFKP